MEKALFSQADKPHVLVVDDDDRIRTLLSRFLRDHDFVVATARNGNEALDVLQCAYFDVLVVDVMMPEKTGFELTQELRETSDLPILLLTALGEVDDRIKGLEIGADDYLSKPFEPKELVLRLRSILKRKGGVVNRNLDRLVIGKWTFLHKIPVEVNDYPGFVANRILMPIINEAIYSLYEGVAGVDEIDQVMKLGMAHPMGPLQLADFIGLDVCLSILNVLHTGFGNPKYAPCPLLVNMVTAGNLGSKSGQGFYTYVKGSKDLKVAPLFKK